MDAELAAYLRHMRDLGRRARNVFLIAVAICGLLAVDVTFMGSRFTGALGSVRPCFGALILWALTAAAYGFMLLSRATDGMTDKAEVVFAADRQKALNQIATIRRRLRGPATPDGK